MPVTPLLFALTSRAWDDLSDGASLVIVTLIIVSGVLLGYALRGLVGRWQADAIEKKMKLRADAAEADLAARRKEADVAARAAVVKAKEEFELSVRARRAEHQAADDRLVQRETALDRKAAALDARESALDAKADETEQAAAAARAAAAAARTARADADRRLCALAEMTHEEARREVMTRAHDELRADADALSRRIQEAAREQGDAIARHLVAEAIQRCAVSHVGEVSTSIVQLPQGDFKGRIVGRDGRNARTFEAATGVTLVMDDDPDAVVLSAFDPLRREVARLALEALVADGRIHPASIEEAVAAARKRVDAASAAAAEAAAAEAGVAGLGTDVLRLMGALRFRFSFTQNVLRHSVEVALLTGTFAAELGLDAALGRRIGFLHDLGKALSGEKKGAHAALGADYLRVHGEPPAVVNAVAAHHGEGDSDGGVYGVLCAAADAISSARPGARQENLGDYVQRLSDIEALARAHAGVLHAFAVHAGRDLRVVVDPAALTDVEAVALARDICREISEKIKFPGMIRVTVVRELRCIEYAK